MKVLIINEVFGTTSTGKICAQLAEKYDIEGNEVKVAYGRWGNVPDEYMKYAIRIGNDIDVRWHAIVTRLFDNHGFASKRATKIFLQWVDEYKPDLIWMHNLHGYYINIELLFGWLKEHPDIEKKWTLHDCWAFTGHCANFTYVNCSKWKTGCNNCCQKKEYPKSFFADKCTVNYLKKKSLLAEVSNLTIITPSKWMANLVSDSFLNEYPVKVIKNSIDINKFKPTPSDFKRKHNIKGKMILGVANIWNEKKGLLDYLKLSNMLKETCTVVLVGLSNKQIKEYSDIILGIGKIDSQVELAKIYTAADYFINLTYEDNFPTVNLEAQACGTKCITYDVGGCAETIHNGYAVECGNLNRIVEIVNI